MKATLVLVMTLTLAATANGCGGGAPEVPHPPPPEEFTWTGGQPILFSPPPGEWKRSRYQNGGTEGVDFVKADSGGEQIYIAERFFLGGRDRCARIQEMRDELDNFDPETFRHAVVKAKLYADESYNTHEERQIQIVNATLDRARQAYLAGNMTSTREILSQALAQASTIRFSIDETVDRALFTAEKNAVYPALRVQEPVADELAGQPAVTVAFTFQPGETPFDGRRTYVVKNNRMFEFGYQGPEEDLPLFAQVLESVTFPSGICEH